MRCRQIRHLIIDAAEQAPDVRQGMEEHIERCERCARFREGVEAIHRGVKDLPRPAPSGRVDARIRALAAPMQTHSRLLEGELGA